MTAQDPGEISSSDVSEPHHEHAAEDHELIEQLDQRRRELTTAADVLQRPLRAVNRTDELIRRVTPMLPYAVAAIAVIGVAGGLMRGRRLRPSLLIATGLDVWRLWKGINAVAVLTGNTGSSRYRPLHQETVK